jgi:hypothetical protein
MSVFFALFLLFPGSAVAKQLPPYVTPQGLDLSPDGKWLLHVEEKGVRLLKVEDRRAPACLSGAEMPGHGSDGKFLAIGGRLYALAADGLGLSVFEVKEERLEPVSRLEISDDNLRGPESIELSGTACYLACRLSGLAVVELADPGKPRLIGAQKTANFARKLAVAGNFAYVADSRGMTVMDVSDPKSPKAAGFYRSPDVATDIAIRGDLAALGCGKNWLVLLDVANPAAPRELSRFRGNIVWYGSFFFDSAIRGDILHVGFSEGGYLRIDVSDPAKPRCVSEYHPRKDPESKAVVFANVFTRAIVVDKDIAYLGDQGHIEVVDISHPSNVLHVALVKTEPPGPAPK